MQALPALPSFGWAFLLIPAVFLAFWNPRALVLVFFIAGASWGVWRADVILQQQLPPALEGQDLLIDGYVAELPQPTDYGMRFAFDVQQAQAGGALVEIPQRLLLSTDRSIEPTPRAGDHWRFTVRLKRPHGLQNPGGFDYEAYLFLHRLRATGYVRAKPAPIYLGEGDGAYRIDRWRETLGERMRALMPDSAYAGLIVALANGDSGRLSDPQWETLRRTGTLHLVAISGMHISLVAGLMYWLVRFLWSLPGVTVLRLPAPMAGAIGGLLAAVLYAALAGFVIPTQRALVMLAVAMGAVLWRRRIPTSRLLAMALLAVLLLDPLAVMAPGFWLSYAAVAVIIYVMHGEPGRRRWWRQWGYLQWAITLGMLPLMLWLFQQLSLIAPLANLLAVPVFDLLLVPLTLLGALFIALGMDGAAVWLLQAGTLLLTLLWQFLEFLATLDVAQWSQQRVSLWAVLSGSIGAVLLLAPRGWPARWIGVVWLAPLFLVRPIVPALGDVWFTVLDVGQGLASIVRTQNHVLIYDAGARWSSRSDAGRLVVLPYLRHYGIHRADILMISHGDNDHAGGAASILRRFPVAHVITGTEKVAGDACLAGQQWRWDEVEFTVLNPVPEQGGKLNDTSCVLRVHSRHGTILLAGDIEKTAERRLVSSAYAELGANILVAPHHGSRTSSTPDFLEAVKPQHVAFAIGYRNRYRHPHPLVVERYVTLGSRLYDSATHGAIEFRIESAGIQISSYRDSQRRYWFASTGLP